MHGVRWAATLLALTLALVAAGCGSDDDDSSSAGASGSGGGSESAVIKDASAAAKLAEAPRTKADAKMPTSSPAPAKGVKLAAVTCAVAIEGCRIISEAHVEAAKELGWETTLVDGKGSPKGWNDAIQSALQSKPDVLALGAILPSAVSDALADAKRQGVTVICTVCGAEVGEEGVRVATGDDFNAPLGEAVGNYILSQGGEDVNALLFVYPEFAVSKLRHDAAKEVIERCETCKTQTVEIKISEWGTTLPQRIQGLLQQNPDVNWIFSPADATALDAINAIEAAGKTGDVQIGGGNGEKQSFQAVRDDTPYVAIGAVPYQLASWQAIDGANRIENGDEPVESASPVRLINSSNIAEIPPGDYYGADFDFRADYLKLWGVGG